MASKQIKANLKLKNPKAERPLSAMPYGIGIEVTGVLCLPHGFASSNPIMPDGFITYTDLAPSSD